MFIMLPKIIALEPTNRCFADKNWPRGRNNVQTIDLQWHGSSRFISDVAESASTSTVISNEVADSTLKPEAENEDTVGQLKGLSKFFWFADYGTVCHCFSKKISKQHLIQVWIYTLVLPTALFISD